MNQIIANNPNTYKNPHSTSQHTLKSSTQSSHKPTIICLIGDNVNGLGDNTIALDMLLAIKRIYDCYLVVFARNVLQELLSELDIVDEFCLLEGELTNPINKTHINAYHAHYLITGSCKKWQLRFLRSTNVRTIITRMKLATLLSPRIRSVAIFNRHITHREAGLLYARAVDSRHFDRMIDSVDYCDCMVANDSTASRQRQSRVRAALRESLVWIGREDIVPDFAWDKQLESKIAFTRAHRSLVESNRPRTLRKLTLANIMRESKPESSVDPRLNPSALSVSSSSMPLYLILVNPFSVLARYSLPPHLWLRLIDRISTLPYCVPVVCTYDKVHSQFMEAICAYDSASENSLPESSQATNNPQNTSMHHRLQERCIIYRNTSSLLDLAALIGQMSVIISPSTGALHLAANLYTPTIALFPRDDDIRWRTQDKRFCFLPNPTTTLSDEEGAQVIENIITMLESMLKL